MRAVLCFAMAGFGCSSLAAGGVLSRAELHKLNTDQALLQDHAMAFLRRTGMSTQAGQASSQQALDEVASQLVRHRNL